MHSRMPCSVGERYRLLYGQCVSTNGTRNGDKLDMAASAGQLEDLPIPAIQIRARLLQRRAPLGLEKPRLKPYKHPYLPSTRFELNRKQQQRRAGLSRCPRWISPWQELRSCQGLARLAPAFRHWIISLSSSPPRRLQDHLASELEIGRWAWFSCSLVSLLPMLGLNRLAQ